MVTFLILGNLSNTGIQHEYLFSFKKNSKKTGVQNQIWSV